METYQVTERTNDYQLSRKDGNQITGEDQGVVSIQYEKTNAGVKGAMKKLKTLNNQ